jgi:Domain of unknown function (DUF222)
MGRIFLPIILPAQEMSVPPSTIELVIELMAWEWRHGRGGAEVISVCDVQDPLGVTDALALLDHALRALAAADAGSLPTVVQAEVLRALARAEARHIAARARVLAAFTARDGYQDDGQGSARVWLSWQTRVTRAAAAGSVGWARRLAAHPVIADALAGGQLSVSWARAICEWTDRLPDDNRDDADQILAAAAAGGAELADLAGLAEQMHQRAHRDRPDPDEDGFDDRRLWLDLTFGGAGRLNGDLTPGCAAAVSAVLEALAKPAGPEDLRTAAQRRHDALEEACRRLIAAGMVPGRAGQPTQIVVHMGLGQLRGRPGASVAEAAWAAGRARQRGWLTGPEADAAACDAAIVPVVTGHVDPAALEQLTDVFLAAHTLSADAGQPPTGAGQPTGSTQPAGARQPGGRAACGCTCGNCTGNTAQTSTAAQISAASQANATGEPLSRDSRLRLRTALLALAADALSGPGGLAAQLRACLDGGPLATVSLPLDIGPASETIPVHLRRAATTRHPHCAFPGCDQPASVCDIHHLLPRAAGGPTALPNLVPLCSFHHKIAIHRWGWALTLHPDGTTTATSPDGRRTCHSHGPPGGGPGPPNDTPGPPSDTPGPPNQDHGRPGRAA